jgi:hypothetical protein
MFMLYSLLSIACGAPPSGPFAVVTVTVASARCVVLHLGARAGILGFVVGTVVLVSPVVVPVVVAVVSPVVPAVVLAGNSGWFLLLLQASGAAAHNKPVANAQ